MAEELEVVGREASLLQLADASIHVCFGLHDFFSVLQRPNNEFRRHLVVTKDVHDSIKCLRKMAETQHLTVAETAVLRSQLNGIVHDLSALESRTIGENPTRCSVQSIHKASETENLLQRLENSKTSLLLLLQALAQYQSNQIIRTKDSQRSYNNSLASLKAFVVRMIRDDISGTSESSKDSGGFVVMDANFQLYKKSLESGFSTITCNHQTQVSFDQLEAVLHSVLNSHILPRIEESLARRSDAQRDASLRDLQTAVNDAVSQIRTHVNEQIMKAPSTAEPSNLAGRFPMAHGAADPWDYAHNSSAIPTSDSNDVGLWSPRLASEWSCWNSVPGIGTFRVEYRIYTQPEAQFCTFKVDFWPSIFFFQGRCPSLAYNISGDAQGYIGLCPSLALHPIVPNEDPIWTLIAHDDVHGIYQRFQDLQNGPFDQNSRGSSLIMEALDQGSHEVIRFLLQHGADPTQTTTSGRGGLNGYLLYGLEKAIVGPMSPPSGHGWRESTNSLHGELLLFFRNFRALVAAGCDPEECTASIFEFLSTETFMDSSLNEYEEDGEEVFRSLHEAMGRHYFIEFEEEEFSDSFTSYDDGGNADESSSSSTAEEDIVMAPPIDKTRYFNTIRELSQFLSRQGVDLLKGNYQDYDLLNTLCSPAKTTLQVLRECGLHTKYKDSSVDSMKSSIYIVLCALIQEFDEYFEIRVENLVSLIAEGADIYEVEWATDHWVSQVGDDGLMSPTAYVRANDIMPVWEYALKAAGYVFREVLLEDERKRREFRRVHGERPSSIPGAGESSTQV